jgi:hypothetical protein
MIGLRIKFFAGAILKNASFPLKNAEGPSGGSSTPNPLRPNESQSSRPQQKGPMKGVRIGD